MSPDTNEFLVLEQQVFLEEQRDHFDSSVPTRNSSVHAKGAAVEPFNTSSPRYSDHRAPVSDQGPSIIVRTASYSEKSPSSLEQEHLLQVEQQKQLLQSELESKLEERKRSIDAAENLVMDEEGQLQMVERRPFRFAIFFQYLSNS
jgi:hypothetical protein